MTEQETLRILKAISLKFPNKFKVDDAKATVKEWHRVLQHYDVEIITERLDAYSEQNEFPPSISELVHQGESRNVPGVVETFEMIESWAENQMILEETEILQHLAAIKAKLFKGGRNSGNHNR